MFYLWYAEPAVRNDRISASVNSIACEPREETNAIHAQVR